MGNLFGAEFAPVQARAEPKNLPGPTPFLAPVGKSRRQVLLQENHLTRSSYITPEGTVQLDEILNAPAAAYSTDLANSFQIEKKKAIGAARAAGDHDNIHVLEIAVIDALAVQRAK